MKLWTRMTRGKKRRSGKTLDFFYMLERSKKKWTFNPNKGTSGYERHVLPRIRRGTVFCFPHIKAKTMHSVSQFFSLALVWKCYSGTDQHQGVGWAGTRPSVHGLPVLSSFSVKMQNPESLLSKESNPGHLEWDRRICILNKYHGYHLY